VSLVRADARNLPIATDSVQCCVTSPPYWGLRDYAVAEQIGLEAIPNQYVKSMVAVFRQVHRVLKEDGVLFLNLGDSYSGIWGNGLKPKDMCGMPWMVAFALRADGWFLRSDIIWSKPNPMPESVTDRPTKSHEYVFMLTKNERYFFDAAAVREPYAESTLQQIADGYNGHATKNYLDAGVQDPSGVKRRIIAGLRKRQTAGANVRSVWSMPTQPYAGAHFATMPEKLVDRCISLGRRAVGTDLNLDYLRLAQERTQVTRGLPLEMGA
jgi:DNA modification methylase